MTRSTKAFIPRQFLFSTHIYANLLCAGYLVIYGLSGLAINHEYQPAPHQVEWERSIVVPTGLSDLKLAEQLRDNLGLIGWVPKWRIRRVDGGNLEFRVFRPAKNYKIQLDRKIKTANVTEIRTGILGALTGLHGLSGVPGSTWAWSWGIYTEVSILALLYALLSGFLIWWQHAAVRRQRWLLFLSGSGTLLLVLSIIR